jgi:hypothetical protein
VRFIQISGLRSPDRRGQLGYLEQKEPASQNMLQYISTEILPECYAKLRTSLETPMEEEVPEDITEDVIDE